MTRPLPDAWAKRTVDQWQVLLGVPRLELHRTLDSTNDRLREMARDGCAPFTTVIAAAQSRGRGRAGKSWHSPAGVGLWMSVLIPFPRWGSGAVLPLAAGVAAARAMEQTSGCATGLKWPNDVFVGGRKVAGILCETAADGVEGAVRWAAVGIGVNLRPPKDGWPVELVATAGSLIEVAGREVEEAELAGALVDELRAWTDPAPSELSGRMRVEWESRDLLRGRRVILDSGGTGVARGVSPAGALRVALDDGELSTVRSGGVRLRERDSSPAPPDPHATSFRTEST